MAIAFCKQPEERLDSVFVGNFMKDFGRALGLEDLELKDIDFSEVRKFVEEERAKKEALTREERKRLSEERKRAREENKRKYGFAIVDGERVEVNYLVEPPCIYVGRGKHPLRGRWKPRVYYRDIVLNLSPDAPTPPVPDGSEWGGREWDPDGLWIAKWRDKLTGKMKYVWIALSAPQRQKRDRRKFDLARRLKGKYKEVRARIEQDLGSTDPEVRKIATAVYLIDELKLRIGHEKDPDELDTIGVTMLEKGNIKIKGPNKVEFDFLGKGAVRFHRTVELPERVVDNLREFLSSSPDERIFFGLKSEAVNRYLSQLLPGLTSKIFRTFHATEVASRTLRKFRVYPGSPEFKKLYVAKRANLEAAKVLNHRRKLPKNWRERVEKQRLKVEELKRKVDELSGAGTARAERRLKALRLKLWEAKLKLKLMRKMASYNLSTSLNNYIDPRVYISWAEKKGLDWRKIYPKSMWRRVEWAVVARSGSSNNTIEGRT